MDENYLLRWIRSLQDLNRSLSQLCTEMEASLPAVHGLRKVLEEERKLEEISSLEVSRE